MGSYWRCSMDNLVDDKILTEFLIRSFSGIFEGQVKPVQKSTIPGANVRQYVNQEGSLAYLETHAGDLFRNQTDIRIFATSDGSRVQVWGMHVRTEFDTHALAAAKIA